MNNTDERTMVVENMALKSMNEARLIAFIAECYTDKITLARNILNIQGQITKEKALEAVNNFFTAGGN